MVENPKISVIMPVYNAEKYLADGLASALAQTFTDFELICVNDGATDGSADILAAYAARDARIVVITQQNQGAAAARNSGMAAARGEYIYFMDADDALHPQLLELTYALAEKHQADMVCFDFLRREKAPTEFAVLNAAQVAYKITNRPALLPVRGKMRMTYNVWTKLCRRDLLQGLNFVPRMYAEDWLFVYEILARQPKTVVIGEKLYFYSYNPASLSHQKYAASQISWYHFGLRRIFEVYKRPELQKERDYLRRTLLPNLLKQQYKRCQDADMQNQAEMRQALAAELCELKQLGLFSWRGHSWRRYWQYCKLIKSCISGGGQLQVVKIFGGMGNQMFQYAFGQSLAARLQQPVYYDLQWFANGKHPERPYALELFDLPIQQVPAAVKPYLPSKKWWRNVRNKLHGYNWQVVKEKQPWLYDASLYAHDGMVYYNGYFQHESYLAPVAEALRRQFTFPPLPEEDTFNRDWLAKIRACENPVCVHIRRGDYLNVAGWALPLAYYQKAFAYMAEHVKNPTFFVFGSESAEFIKNELKVDFPFEFVGEENAKNHADWKDMLLMSACKHKIIANSTFSWWAAWLGEVEGGLTIAPSPFLEGQDAIVPDRWIKLSF